MIKMLKKVFYPSILRKMIAVFVSIILVPLLVLSIITNKIFSEYTISVLISNLNYSSEKINNDFKSFVESIDKLTLDIVYNEFIQLSLQEETENYKTYVFINRFLGMLHTENIRSIIYVDNKGQIFSTDKIIRHRKEDLINSKIYSKIKNTYGKLVWSFNKDDLNPDDDSYYIFAGRYVQHLDMDIEPGFLIIKIDLRILRNFLFKGNTEEKGRYVLCDPSGFIICDSENQENTGKFIEDKYILELIRENRIGSYVGDTSMGESLITYNSDNNAGWSILGIIPYSTALRELRKLQGITSYITFISILVSAALAIIYSLSFTRPIKEIVNSMRRVRKGDFAVQVRQNRKDEIGELAESFNKMSLEIQTLVKKVEQDQQELKVSELNSLIHQINPHFLYNTLDNINMLAKLSKEKRISELITALSKLLRISLSGGKDIISVSDEVEHVRNYLLIQKMRYGNLFDFEIDVDEGLKDKEVIKLILQPLAENAISHGFKNMSEGGFINIQVCKDKEYMIFQVKDNGRGLPGNKIYELNNLPVNMIKSNEKCREKGYGVSNVNLRLRLFYGNSCRVIFSNNPEGGLTGRIMIPLSKEQV